MNQNNKNFSLDRILNMTVDEFNKLSTADLREVSKVVNRNARTRSSRLEKAKMTYSPAYRQYNGTKRAKKFQVGVKKGTKFERQHLQKSITHATTFLRDSTSKVSQMRKINKTADTRLGISMNEFQRKKFWRAYRTAMKDVGNISKAMGLGSEGLQKKLAQYKVENNRLGYKKLSDYLEEVVKTEYEDRMQKAFDYKSDEGDFGYDIGGEDEEEY